MGGGEKQRRIEGDWVVEDLVEGASLDLGNNGGNPAAAMSGSIF